jgi:ankyrin repeat protein
VTKEGYSISSWRFKRLQQDSPQFSGYGCWLQLLYSGEFSTGRRCSTGSFYRSLPQFIQAAIVPDMVSLFLDKGADINTLTAWGMSPLCLAIDQKNETMVQLLREQGANVDLSAAIAQQNWKLAETLLDAEPSKIQSAGKYQFLLHHTVKQGLAEATKMLLKYGADASIKTTHLFIGDYQTLFTPLHVAALYSQHQVAVILLDNSVQVNTISSGNMGITPLHLAAMKGDIEMIKLLLAQGADLTLKDSVHQGTPFDWAKNFEQEAAMNMLK